MCRHNRVEILRSRADQKRLRAGREAHKDREMNPAIPNKPSYREILKMKAAGDALFDKLRAGKSPKDGPNRSTSLISSSQIRAARHLANLSQADIAGVTGLLLPTIRRAESKREVSVSKEAIATIRAALESAGVEFIAENGGGAGVRLKRPR
jgi:hypothetical protein